MVCFAGSSHEPSTLTFHRHGNLSPNLRLKQPIHRLNQSKWSFRKMVMPQIIQVMKDIIRPLKHIETNGFLGSLISRKPAGFRPLVPALFQLTQAEVMEKNGEIPGPNGGFGATKTLGQPVQCSRDAKSSPSLVPSRPAKSQMHILVYHRLSMESEARTI